MQLSVRVPASTANLGPGFDVLGLSLGMYLEVAVQPAERTRVIYHGRRTGEAGPELADNLVHRAIVSLCGEYGKPVPELEIEIDNPIPLRGGLGSSGAAVVAGLRLGNALLGLNLSDDELLPRATALEGHPDNVSASLYGGLTVCLTEEGGAVHCLLPPVPDPPAAVVLHPHVEIATVEARRLLPATLSRADAVRNLGGVGAIVAGLSALPRRLHPAFFRDTLHQCPRSALMPWLPAVIAAAEAAGAEGCFLSGSGPSILAFSPAARTDAVQSGMFSAMTSTGIPFDTFTLATAVPSEDARWR